MGPFNDAGSSPQELRVVDVATGVDSLLAVGPDTQSLEVIAFSPDGDHVLFSQRDVNLEGSLWSVRADGSGAQLLVAGTNDGDWQPVPTGS